LEEDQLHELLYQALETELGGVEIYEKALECVRNADLGEEWRKYLRQTQHHVVVVERMLNAFELDPHVETPGRAVVREIGSSLVKAMELALENGAGDAAELVAAECVTLAETKDHLNWELLGEVVKELEGARSKAVRSALEEVEEQEDEHLYHTTGWARELWIDSLGIPSVLPPPEEQKDVKTAIGAARARHGRSGMS
jgi:rubrerythrin